MSAGDRAAAARQAVTFEIIRGKLLAAADEMGVVLARTSMSPVIYEVLDFACGIVDAEAQVISQTNGITVFTGTFAGHVNNIIRRFGGAMRPGDIYMANDPYEGGTHLSDVAIIKPIFADGEVIAYSIAVAHWTDIGGKVAGSLPMDATEIFHEGLRFVGHRIYDAGERCEDLVDLIAANTRIPKMSLGDLNAELASVRIAEARMLEICEKYGVARTQDAFRYMMETGERLSRAAIRALPDGVYEAEDFIDGDGVDNEPFPVRVAVRIDGDSITFDFTGSSPQRRGPVNCAWGAHRSAVKTAFKALVGPHEPGNEGWFKPLSIVVPDGTVFCAVYPAPVCWHFEAGCHASELIWKALAPLAPDRYGAGSYLSLCSTFICGTDPTSGEPFIVVEPNVGGWGAINDHDGASALIGISDGDTYNTSIELCEAKYPVRVQRYALNTEDGTGAGRYRGGFGVVRDYEISRRRLVRLRQHGTLGHAAVGHGRRRRGIDKLYPGADQRARELAWRTSLLDRCCARPGLLDRHRRGRRLWRSARSTPRGGGGGCRRWLRNARNRAVRLRRRRHRRGASSTPMPPPKLAAHRLGREMAMTPQEFVDTLRRHDWFTRGLTGGARARLVNQDLSGLRLPELNLREGALTGVDFTGCMLEGADLSNADLFGAVFDGSDCSGVNFAGADLKGARFRNANLAGADFRAADLRPGVWVGGTSDGSIQAALTRSARAFEAAAAKLSEADLHNASELRAQLTRGSLARVDMHGADLSGANLEAATLDEANLTGTNLENARVRGARFNGANLHGAILSNVELTAADVTDAKLCFGVAKLPIETQRKIREHALWTDSFGLEGRRAELSGMAMPRCDLTDVYLSGAVLRDCDLSGATLRGAEFVVADLSGANLNGANIWDADFSGAALANADLRGVNLASAKLDSVGFVSSEGEATGRSRKVSLAGANLSGNDLRRIDLRGIDLSAANSSGCNLAGSRLARMVFVLADVSEADLGGADLRRADFRGADLSNADLSHTRLLLAEFGPVEGEGGGGSGGPVATRLMGANLGAAGLSGANFENADLSGATLASADLGTAEFLGADGKGTGQHRATTFLGASLRGADLSDLKLDQAITTGADMTGATGIESEPD